MTVLRRINIRSFEIGLRFKNGEFAGLLEAGRHWLFDPLGRRSVKIASLRDPWLVDDQLDVIVKSGALEGRAEWLDLDDHQRALVWVDGRLERILKPGLYAWWTGQRRVRAEVIDARDVRFDHAVLPQIENWPQARALLDICAVERERAGVLFVDGRYVRTLTPGLYAFWRGTSAARIVELDLREQVLDVAGQELMTADKVSLRLNAVVTYRIADAHRAVVATENASQSLYREAQLALRAIVGTRDLDQFLNEKDAIVEELEAQVRRRAEVIGLQVDSVGIRDVILPGDMKDLMNKVTEARKAAEANLIVRREETAAMRSQANTAKLLEQNPVLMRLKELEILERIAAAGQLNVVLGEQGLTDRVLKLL